MKANEWIKVPKEQVDIIEKHNDTFPIPLGLIAKELGLVVKKATLPARISGEIKQENDKFIIRINRHDVKARQRYTLAHEIAHFLLHKSQIGDGISDDVLYRSSLSNKLEVEANKLGADIIMPWHLITNSLSKFPLSTGDKLYEQLAEIAGVSTTALKFRLGK
ncbi:50S ribosomal protein L22 [Psychromonas sp. CNPT3]|uniref:ImmA/IrrE family metallo-endopeptidase n=1 Tax=Psychromonas sp. CNPT3 TaxID=314282 RepID=UPI00006E8956|nr:ImmA/IrrE family metallo-endopeptidase [Psychromonas sp. CNPT3]AGH80032.1 50S ribosomal protein L22 [Psychromonas sp. CNPT3]